MSQTLIFSRPDTLCPPMTASLGKVFNIHHVDGSATPNLKTAYGTSELPEQSSAPIGKPFKPMDEHLRNLRRFGLRND